MNFTDLQNVVSASNWEPSEKEKIAKLAPQLGRRLLGYLIWFESQTGSYLNAVKVVDAALMIAGWHELLQKNGSTKIINQFLSSWKSGNWYVEQALLFGILDIKANVALAHNISPELLRLFNLLECIHFEKLFPSEVERLLKDSAASIASFADLSEEIKRYHYLLTVDEADDSQLTKFKTALESNNEEIGLEPLMVSSGTVRPSVANWFKMFAESRTQSGRQSSYNIAYFVTRHPVAGKLADSDKAVLADLLRLYAWLLRPEIFADEIKHYEQERVLYYDSVKSDLIAMAQGYEQESLKAKVDSVAAPKAVVGAVTGAQTRNEQKLGGVVIDAGKPAGSAVEKTPFNAPEPMSEIEKEFASGAGKTVLGGIAMNEGTNIAIEEESQRLQTEREKKLKSIQDKLDILRKRNNVS